MSNNEKRTKPKYETPIVVNLGEMARGAGACSAGTADVVDCSAGTAALNACTAGVSAVNGCTAGGFKL